MESLEDKAKRLNIPIIEPLQPVPDQSGPIAICGQCGMDIYRVMGYCCGNSRCPVQPRATFIQSAESGKGEK